MALGSTTGKEIRVGDPTGEACTPTIPIFFIKLPSFRFSILVRLVCHPIGKRHCIVGSFEADGAEIENLPKWTSFAPFAFTRRLDTGNPVSHLIKG